MCYCTLCCWEVERKCSFSINLELLEKELKESEMQFCPLSAFAISSRLMDVEDAEISGNPCHNVKRRPRGQRKCGGKNRAMEDTSS